MPINYYCSIKMNGSDINMDYNELLVPVIDNETSAPNTGSEVKGQMYMNTTDNTMYFYNGTAWVEMDGSGSGVSSFKATDGTFIDFAPNTATTGAITLTGDLSAGGSPGATTFLRGDNTWATPAGAYTSWELSGDAGTPVDITDGLKVDFTGGIGIDTTVAAATPNTLTIDLDVNKLTSATPVKTDFIAFSDESVTGDPTRKAKIETVLALAGFVEGAGPGLKKVGTNLEVDYSNSGIINDANAGTSVTLIDTDEFIFEDVGSTAASAVKRGTLSQLKTYIGADNYGSWTLSDGSTTQTISSGNTVTVTAPAAGDPLTGLEPVVVATDTLRLDFDSSRFTGVTTIDGGNDEILFFDSNNSQNASITPVDIHLNQWGAPTADLSIGSKKLTNVADGTASSHGVNLGQVQSLIAGTGLFEGGYNANTGLTTDQSPNGAINGASNIATGLGDFYAVTTAGTQLGVALEVGDLIFANVAIAASSNPANSDFTIVQSGQSIAGEGASDNATTKGIAGFNSAHFSVTANGWVSADIYGGGNTLGIVPSGGSATTFLRGDGSWQTPSNDDTKYDLTVPSGTTKIRLAGSDSTNDDVEIAGTGLISVTRNTASKLTISTSATANAGTVTSVACSVSGDAYTATVTNSTTAASIAIAPQGTSSQYIDGAGNLTTFPSIPQGDITEIKASSAIDLLGINIDAGTGPIPKVGLDIDGLTAHAAGDIGSTDKLVIYDVSETKNVSITSSQLAGNVFKARTVAATITGYGTVTHNLGTYDVIVQCFDNTSKETVNVCVDRTSINAVGISGASFPTGNIRVLISAVGI